MPLLIFDKDGVEIRQALLTQEMIDAVKSDIDLNSSKLQTCGVRNLEKKFSSIARLATDKNIILVAKSVLKAEVRLVRALFFDKTPDKNWFVNWHQDKTVSLNRRAEMDGWGPWSIKDGVHHVQPPVEVLNKMLTLRLHIDCADEQNGCLKVIPGSHRRGLLQPATIDSLVKNSIAVPCIVNAGDALIMRPHILHASSKATKPNHRRVVHLEYSSYSLPEGFAWA